MHPSFQGFVIWFYIFHDSGYLIRLYFDTGNCFVKPENVNFEKDCVFIGDQAAKWIREHLPQDFSTKTFSGSTQGLQILAYQKFKSKESRKGDTDRTHAILCAPRSCFQHSARIFSEATELQTSTNDRDEKRKKSNGQPPVRTKSPKTGLRTQVLAIGDAQSVQLRVSTARSTRWGLQLQALKRVGTGSDFDPGQPLAFLESAGFRPIDIQRISRNIDLRTLITNALLIAHRAKTEGFVPPTLPILHNHLDGYRYTLWIDRKNHGSPYPIQILIHEDESLPQLSKANPQIRGYATERKPELLLAANESQSVRFYLPTDDQWKQFEERRAKENSGLPEDIRKLVENTVQITRKLIPTPHRTREDELHPD